MKRRTFLKTGVLAGAAMSAPAVLTQARDKKYKTATIGSGWWGMNITRYAIESGACQVVGLCDVDRNHLDPAAEEVEKLSGDQPRKYGDYREMLEKEKPEIVIVGTPDHWHPLCAIAAVDAGAHIYVEKPISHTIREGRAMVNAARAANRIVQVGTHRRVGVHNVSALRFLRSGKVGQIGMVRAFVHYHGGSGEPTPDSEPPAGLDWDMWCGPAPLRPFNPRIHPRGFRRFLDYANGQLGDWGIHWLDQILWWTEEKYPKKVCSMGGRHIAKDNSDAPDTQIVTYEFDSFTATWEHRWFAGNDSEKHNIGVYFYGTDGVFHLGWTDGWTFYPRNGDPIHEDCVFHNKDNENIRELFADFLESIQTGFLPVCDIEIGHRSTTMSLLGMLSLRYGHSIDWDGEKELITDHPDANKLLSRVYRAPWKYPGV
ncbi:MAG: gfo/Idh/MocA family oxidoreductase [Candidatus Omnitrophota bacterium]|jgi:predicted dehydrogenase|nr:MAG: gfo/Idh/MocA family oxidoreductase [Candidatus Omnitrophota bacterium]